MTVDYTGRIKPSNFTGHSRLSDSLPNSLGTALRKVLQSQARSVVEAAAIAGITDSSGAAAGASVLDVDSALTFTDTSSAGGLTAASLDISVGTFLDAYATLVEQQNLVRALLGMGSAPVGDGTPGGGTIAALDVDVAAASGDASVSVASANAILTALVNAQRNVVQGIDDTRLAVGLDPMALESSVAQGSVTPTLVWAAVAAAAAVAAGTSATTGVAEADVEAELVILGKNVAFLADKMDEVTAIALGDVPLGVFAG